ncbi:MAG: universal stress protein [Reichenbachiella sp.]
MDIKRILVPMDFSHCAINALQFAKRLAHDSNASIMLMNVSHQPQVYVEAMGAGAIMQPIMTEYEKHAEENFSELIEKEGLKKFNVSTRSFSMGFIDAINSCLNEDNIDLVITGTNEYHDFLDSMFGSKSADIISTSKVPVMMIPECAQLEKIKKIGVAINFENDNDYKKLDITRTFARLLDAQIIILNIAKNSKKLFYHDDDKVSLSNFYKGIDHLFFSLNDKGDLVNILQDSSKELGLDMLFMHPKNHKGIDSLFYKSKTKSMAMQIDIPLLTVHE